MTPKAAFLRRRPVQAWILPATGEWPSPSVPPEVFWPRRWWEQLQCWVHLSGWVTLKNLTNYNLLQKKNVVKTKESGSKNSFEAKKTHQKTWDWSSALAWLEISKHPAKRLMGFPNLLMFRQRWSNRFLPVLDRNPRDWWIAVWNCLSIGSPN